MSRMTIGETIADGGTSFFRLRPGGVEDADVALVGIPFDAGTTYRAGARFGPYGVRRASLALGGVDREGIAVFETLRVADGGNLVCNPFDIHSAQDMIREQAAAFFARNVVPVFVGGDHSCTFGLLQAAARRHGPLAVVHFDAHADTSSAENWGTPQHHGTVFRNAIEDGCLDGTRFVQVGLRGPYGEPDPHAFTRSHGGTVFEAEDFDHALAHLASLAVRWGERPVYLTIDIDAIDPAFAPGTGTPVSGGLTPLQMFRGIRALRDLNIVGADVMEIAPDLDHADMTSLVGAHLVFEILSAIASRRQAQG